MCLLDSLAQFIDFLVFTEQLVLGLAVGLLHLGVEVMGFFKFLHQRFDLDLFLLEAVEILLFVLAGEPQLACCDFVDAFLELFVLGCDVVATLLLVGDFVVFLLRHFREVDLHLFYFLLVLFLQYLYLMLPISQSRLQLLSLGLIAFLHVQIVLGGVGEISCSILKYHWMNVMPFFPAGCPHLLDLRVPEQFVFSVLPVSLLAD